MSQDFSTLAELARISGQVANAPAPQPEPPKPYEVPVRYMRGQDAPAGDQVKIDIGAAMAKIDQTSRW